MQKRQKSKYRIVTIRYRGELLDVWCHKRDIKAFKHIVKSGSEAALEATLCELTDEESERISNGGEPLRVDE